MRWLLPLFLLAGCDSTPEAKPSGKVEIVAVPAGSEELTAIVQREAARAQKDGKQLLIYVGAEWCEPCKRFHAAAEAGELDRTFPSLRLLELDRDRDEARLARAGCLSKLIPLFAVPDAQGRCSDRRIEGSIKGPGAVAEISPRLAAILR